MASLLTLQCPVAASHVNEEELCETYTLFKGSDYDLVPMVIETSGALNDEGLEVLKQILRRDSTNSRMGHSSFGSQAGSLVMRHKDFGGQNDFQIGK